MSEKPNTSESADQTVVTSIERLPVEGEKNAYILFLSGPLVGKLQLLKEGATILGRAPDVQIVINDNRISRHHLEIHVSSGEARLRDLGSTNGTFVNGKRAKEHLLMDGDKVQISSATIFKFAYQDNIENVFHKELYKMAVLDAVTNLFNKRYFMDRLKEEFAHARRTKQPLSLLMMDLDHFKKINDTYGHLAGDFVLAHLADLIKEMIRGEDVLARYGGEEFALILRGTDESGATQLAERIRVKIEQMPTNFEGTEIPATVSIGVAYLKQENYASLEAFIAGADQFLYQSKGKGRNCTSAEGFH